MECFKIYYVQCFLKDEISAIMRPGLSGICEWNKHFYPANFLWNLRCNSCVCAKSSESGKWKASCSEIWCGQQHQMTVPTITRPDADLGNDCRISGKGCRTGEVCAAVPVDHCLSGDCSRAARGKCVDSDTGLEAGLPDAFADPRQVPHCLPTAKYPPPGCSLLNIVLSPARLSPATPRVTVDDVCANLRSIAGAKYIFGQLGSHPVVKGSSGNQTEAIWKMPFRQPPLVFILCDLKPGTKNTITAAIVSINVT